MKFFSFFKNKIAPASQAPLSTAPVASPSSNKERDMVDRIAIDDMMRFTSAPYRWDNDIEKFVKAGGHPFAYMNLSDHNVKVAVSEIQKINQMLADLSYFSRIVPANLSIPTNQLKFTESRDRGHTRLICTPFTPTGKNAKYPYYLLFMTDISDSKNSSHGELHYLPDGSIGKATVYLWRNGKGYFIYYKTVEGTLTLSKIDHLGHYDLTPRTIYKLNAKK